MEFLKPNIILTSTSIVVGSNTLAAKNILNRDLTFQYTTDGLNDDLTTGSVTLSFDSTTTIDRIPLMGINLKSFTMFYNGSTANTFAMTTTANTTVSDWITNGETSIYLMVTPVDVTSVTIDMKTTMVADQEKAVGYISLSELKLDFPQIPSAKDYTPIFLPKEVVHKLSDGGTRIHFVDEKRSVGIKLNNIEQSFRDDLKTIKDERSKFAFAGFGTSTGWDEFYFECVWPGKFEFYKHSDSALEAGFKGKIDLREI